MHSTDAAQKVRSDLKAELGLSSKAVSVRKTNGGSVRVTIRTLGVSRDAVETIARRVQEIRRCEFSGEILEGGNTFVFIDFDDSIFDGLVDDYLASVEEIPVGSCQYVADGILVCLYGQEYSVRDEDDVALPSRSYSPRGAALLVAKRLNERQASKVVAA